jgi:hypothetical protein
MNASATKIASLLSTLAACFGLATFGTGCIIVDPGPDAVVVDTTVAAIPEVFVDTGAQMSASSGDGVGLFVQYQGDGRWDLFTTCDTATSGAACNFDVIITPSAGDYFSGVMGTDLGPTSDVTLESDGSIRLVTDTDVGTDGVSFDADPGATIEVDVLLDGVSQPRFIFAVSDGVLLQGVPGNPVDFTPAVP